MGKLTRTIPVCMALMFIGLCGPRCATRINKLSHLSTRDQISRSPDLVERMVRLASNIDRNALCK